MTMTAPAREGQLSTTEWLNAWCDGFIAASALNTGTKHGREIYERLRDEYLARRPAPAPVEKK